MEAIVAAVRDGDRETAVGGVEAALAAGTPPQTVLDEGLVAGLRQLGELFKDGQAFLPEILISVRAMDAGLAVLQPLLAGDAAPSKGKVVVGTVEGDLHDIGKRLVAMLLRGNGYEVVDLGVDVAAQSFAEAAAEHDADIIALSALLTTTTPQFSRVIAALADAGLRGSVKVMVGGAPVSRGLADEVGADGFADDCVLAVDEAERLLGDGPSGVDAGASPDAGGAR
jgi:5-methyltetrahydrofolate--homocysteine methyltransferase